jgi:hypothetical protein
MDFLSLYERYLDQGYSEFAAARLAGETDNYWEYEEEQESWWD